MKHKNDNQYSPIILHQEEEKVTIFSVFRKKFYTWLENSPISKIFLSFLEILLFFLVIISVCFPQKTAEILMIMMSWHGFLIPKIIAVTLILVFRSEIKNRFKKLKKRHNQHTLEGVPVSELLHFLFDSQGFIQKDFQKRFGLGQKIHGKIAKKLESIGVLVRGENNARVLSDSFTLEEVRELLEGRTKASDISHFRIFQNGEKKAKNKEEIEQDIEEFSKNPFKKRKLYA